VFLALNFISVNIPSSDTLNKFTVSFVKLINVALYATPNIKLNNYGTTGLRVKVQFIFTNYCYVRCSNSKVLITCQVYKKSRTANA
jgi:hypothetical protein